MIRALAVAVALALAPFPAGAARVVSLNLCADDYLLLLAPEHAVAVSVLAADPSLSVVVAEARQVREVRADAEAVLELHPDLVLAGPYGAQTTLALLQRQGVRVERLGLPQDFTAIAAETRRVAGLLDESARGEALLDAMRARLAAARRQTAERAVFLEARGYVAGPDRSPTRSCAPPVSAPPGRAANPGLEALVAHPPDLLVTATAPDYPSLATDLLVHPALAGIPRRAVAPALLLCGGPWTARAVSALAR